MDSPAQPQSDGTFHVISTSLETPYDIAKRRQSEIPYSSKQELRLDTIIDYVPLTTHAMFSDHMVKLVVVGDGGCGKTCMLISYSRGEFPEGYVPTIFENYISQVRGSQGKIIQLSLWDTAGQEEYDRLRPLSYPDTNVVVVCYAVNNIISLHNVREKWAPEVKMFCEDVPLILVGTKLDMLSSSGEDAVSFEEAEQLSKEIGAIKHIRCSAKTTENIRDVFNVALAISQNDLEQLPRNRFGFKKMKSRFALKKNSDIGYNEYQGNDRIAQMKPTKLRKGKKKCVIL